MSKATSRAATGGGGGGGGGPTVNIFDPVAVARADPYFKRNHMGKVTCTLCSVYCNDENAFIKHTAGKTHTLQLENMDRQRRKRQRLDEEAKRDAEKAAAAAKEKATKDLLSTSAGASGGAVAASSGATASGVAVVAGRFGLPLYTFRTEHEDDPHDGDDNVAAAEEEAEAEEGQGGGRARARDAKAAGAYQTKVWLDFHFGKAEEGTRPLHRWLSAREQHVDTPADDYYVYLLVACEGYTTVALRFPAKLQRTQEGDACDASGESVYSCWWDPLRKTYALYFILSR